MNKSPLNYTTKVFVLVLLAAYLGISKAQVEMNWWPTEPTRFELVTGGRRRRLDPFQLCLLCKCCSTTICTTMPCCFGIDCQLPNKPFGVCAFVPKTCNCTSCAV
ncbi:uncharacterized protein LOC110824325 [Carica papaya]|uniref:uncharacterized protein LOC110824325 n=1 Tax=Carica papaya TaxID=3649 RepID=UPI000B8CB917|nr:uncharacterized protein LOC110824325 [Carica papaya]